MRSILETMTAPNTSGAKAQATRRPNVIYRRYCMNSEDAVTGIHEILQGLLALLYQVLRFCHKMARSLPNPSLSVLDPHRRLKSDITPRPFRVKRRQTAAGRNPTFVRSCPKATIRRLSSFVR